MRILTKREAEGQREDVMMAAGSGVMQGQRQGRRHPRSWKGSGNRFLLGPPEATALLTP